jgi:hypothetical protein
MIKKILISVLGAGTLLFAASCSDDNSSTTPTPQPGGFAMKQGDVANYNNYIVATGSKQPDGTIRRRVVATNQTLFGKTGVAIVVDSSFDANGAFVAPPDTSYFAADANGVYLYNLAGLIVSRAPSLGGFNLGIAQPTWAQVAAFRDTEGPVVASDSLKLQIKGTPFGDLPLNLGVSTKPLGKGTETIGTTTYSVFKQEVTVSGTVPFINAPVSLTFNVSIGGTGGTNSPSTVVIFAFQPIEILGTTVEGLSQELVSFTPGS